MTQTRDPGEPIDEQDLLALEALAEEWSDGDDGGMPLEALDGFFSALIVGPGTTVAMGEYLETATGAGRMWGSEEAARRALELLMRFWNHIVWRVAQPLPDEDDESEQAMEHGFALLPLIGLPVAEEEHEVDPADPLQGVPRDFPVGAMWASGFMQGVAQRAEAWEQWLVADEDLVADLQDVSRLALVDPAQAEEMGLDWEERLDFEQRWDLLLAVPGLLQDLNLSRMEEAAREPIRGIPQPGRNDPCPCGSGRKWKKCCGTTLH